MVSKERYKVKSSHKKIPVLDDIMGFIGDVGKIFTGK